MYTHFTTVTTTTYLTILSLAARAKRNEKKKEEAVMTREMMTTCPAVQFSFVIRVLTTIGLEIE
jgi:hypothetical protein